ncbi:archease [Gillisia sp. M10.2A]|uniref:Archease n=1 Tax=Gillisia lutea TaxID=2909668 RepID=A0ABS9EFB8_9FLAO|nr:archease [Gillisia lutea]MCF4101569.1 archease [Gillisia lutea]
MKIRYLPHTADVRMLLEAESLQKLFVAGTKGMSNLLKEGICDHTFIFHRKTTIKTSASDFTNLLIDFLSDVLSHTYANNTIYCKINILSFKKYGIVAEIFGNEINEFDEEIKAVTYHEANVVKNAESNLWETCIIFDI